MTLRAHICVVNFSLFLALSTIHGCASKAKPAPKAKSSSETVLKTLDVGGMGRPDTWRWVRPSPNGKFEVLLKEEIDLNHDGKVDIQKLYNDGKLSRIAMDLDFDRRFDLTEIYDHGVLARIESSRRFDGNIDTWRFYEKGELVRMERDTNADGKADEWHYYVDNRLERTARDLNFDGVVDIWE